MCLIMCLHREQEQAVAQPSSQQKVHLSTSSLAGLSVCLTIMLAPPRWCKGVLVGHHHGTMPELERKWDCDKVNCVDNALFRGCLRPDAGESRVGEETRRWD